MNGEVNMTQIIEKIQSLEKEENIDEVICLLQVSFEHELCKITGLKQKELFRLFDAVGKHEFSSNFIKCNDHKIQNILTYQKDGLMCLWDNNHIALTKKFKDYNIKISSFGNMIN
ncbi:hypothetical protein A4S06_11340 [Erysipelotrichaceae bacterium MTC7]|nr:hypothetical protein A4S06_11340 [Erysipelotrichaceae bacterium MTC7]